MYIKNNYTTIAEVLETIQALPLIRSPKNGLATDKTVVACLASQLNEAIQYFSQGGNKLPQFYVLGDHKNTEHSTRKNVSIFDFTLLRQEMDIHVYFSQHIMPVISGFTQLAMELTSMGIMHYSYERYCSEKFWRRNSREKISDAEWQVVLDFTNLLEDTESKYCYLAVIKALIRAEPGYIPLAHYKQYFHPLVKVEENEILCEGGPSDGATTLDFYNAMQKKGKIYAFEPRAKAWDYFTASTKNCNNIITLEKKALWSKTGFVNLDKLGEYSALITENSVTGATCPATSIDDYFADKESPTCIKLDVEGAEAHVIKGALNTIYDNHPKLLLSTYHRCAGTIDQISIPKLLLELNANYSLYCGHHKAWYAETMIYAKKK